MKRLSDIIMSWIYFPITMSAFNRKTLCSASKLNIALKTIGEIQQILSFSEIKMSDKLGKIDMMCKEFDEEYQRLYREFNNIKG